MNLIIIWVQFGCSASFRFLLLFFDAKLFLSAVSLATSGVSSTLVKWISSKANWATTHGSMIALFAVGIHATCTCKRKEDD